MSGNDRAVGKSFEKRVLGAFRKHSGMIRIIGKVRVTTLEDLATYYTPGVSYPPLQIRNNKALAYEYTGKGNRIAILSDGSRILGLGNIGPDAGMPVMEGKSLLFKKFGDIDALPMAINARDVNGMVAFAKAMEPSIGGINIEDVSNPNCFELYDRLQSELDIPVFHDDRQGTGVVTDAALRNAMKLAKKNLKNSKVVINGVGAAGIGIAEIILAAGCKNLIMCDTRGILYKGRGDNMNSMKLRLAEHTNPGCIKGQLGDAIKGADVIIGASTHGAFKPGFIKTMADKPVVFALSNPYPEIEYVDAKKAGAYIAATGDSGVPNQVNNVLAFPGIFRGVLDVRARRINAVMLLEASRALANSVKKRTTEHIIPNFVDDDIIPVTADIAAAVAAAAIKTGVARRKMNPNKVRKDTKERLERYAKFERVNARN